MTKYVGKSRIDVMCRPSQNEAFGCFNRRSFTVQRVPRRIIGIAVNRIHLYALKKGSEKGCVRLQGIKII